MLERVTLLLARWAVPAGCLALSVLAACWAVYGWLGPQTTLLVVSLAPVPQQLALVVGAGWLLRDPTLPPLRRIAWLCLLTAELADAFATVGWAQIASSTHEVYGTWVDMPFMLYYPLMALACAALFIDAGGSWRRPRVWLDAATIALALTAALWPFLVTPLAQAAARHDVTILVTLGYNVGNILVMTAAAMLFMQIMDWRSQRSTLVILCGMATAFLADLWWVSAEIGGRYSLGGLYDVGYCFPNVFFTAALVLERQRDASRRESRTRAGNAYGFLPVLAVLLAISLLFLEAAGPLTNNSWWLAATVLLSAGLLALRQFGVRHEMQRLHTALAVQQADQRMTELVRRSSDLIAVADQARLLTYVSPAADAVLGRPPAALLGTPATALLGLDNAASLTAFLDHVAATPGTSQEFEAELTTPAGERRALLVLGSNQLATATIEGLVLTVRDVTERRQLEQQLRSLAFFDPLTLLANRSLFADRVEHAVGRIRDGCRPAVLFIDLDNFKAINDGLGHEAGDQLLRTSAQRIVQGTRESDTVARLGGDEFAVLLDDVASSVGVQTVAHGILDRLAAPMQVEGRALSISASIGMCLAGPGTSAEHLLRHADAAMYRAKSLGKGQAVMFESSMLDSVRRRLQIEQELGTALERREFLLHYQPVVDLKTGQLLGAEALIRWRHPRLGILPPAEFISVAEDTGLIAPMTRWVLQQATSDIARARRSLKLGDGLRVSVNVSGECLQQDQTLADVEQALAASGLDPGSLVLEVTEGLLLQSTREIGNRVAALKRLGVRIALDDFGTGYSSLAYLHRFPVDILKMDRSFVQQMGASDAQGKAAALARAILSLADALGLDAVAEGVETTAQREALLALGCRTGQGFLFGKPMPLADLMQSGPAMRREQLAREIEGPVDFTASGRFCSRTTDAAGWR